MKNRMAIGWCLLGSICLLALTGCIRFSTQQGVANTWRDEACPEFATGKTTQSEVMQALGPPSQILTLQDGLAFYYLREFGQGCGLLLLAYNQGNVHFEYDRAVFFFDRKGILTDFSLSEEEAPRP